MSRSDKDQARPNADTLMRLADSLGVTGDYLIEGATDAMATDRLSDEQLLKQFQQVEKLPEDDKAVIKKVLNAFLLQQKMQEMIAG